MIDQLLDNLLTDERVGLDETGAARARAMWREGQPLDDVLRQVCRGEESDLLAAVARQCGLDTADLLVARPDKQLVGKYPAKVLLDHHLLPMSEHNGTVCVATSRAFDRRGLDELRVLTGKQVRIALAPVEQIDTVLRQTVGVGADTLESLELSERVGIEVIDEGPSEDADLEEQAQDASIIKLVNQVIGEAVILGATDVHVEPFEQELRVRYRVDGVLVEANVPPSVARFRLAIVSRLKILAHLDIAEKRKPQDGRIKLKITGREVDVRVSVIPMLHGEAVVLRLLDRGSTLLGLEHLGMSSRDAAEFGRVLDLPHGIVLVTGPTGSGKTTSLYAGLSRINTMDTKIITIEDPVEYQLHGVNQIQVSEKTGLTFAMGLRSILRHDPDVVLIGEIRDHETAQIAVQASLTGHLVFSTLHTNDAPGALTRLVDMGIEPYLVASSLELVMAQRLVRVICPHCKQRVSERDMARLRDELQLELPDELYHGVGCQHCQQTGFRGRTGVFEMMPISERIEAMVLEHASSGQIRRVAIEEGMLTLREDGMRLVREGRTTLNELMRVTKDERNGGRPAVVL